MEETVKKERVTPPHQKEINQPYMAPGDKRNTGHTGFTPPSILGAYFCRGRILTAGTRLFSDGTFSVIHIQGHKVSLACDDKPPAAIVKGYITTLLQSKKNSKKYKKGLAILAAGRV